MPAYTLNDATPEVIDAWTSLRPPTQAALAFLFDVHATMRVDDVAPLLSRDLFLGVVSLSLADRCFLAQASSKPPLLGFAAFVAALNATAAVWDARRGLAVAGVGRLPGFLHELACAQGPRRNELEQKMLERNLRSSRAPIRAFRLWDLRLAPSAAAPFMCRCPGTPLDPSPSELTPTSESAGDDAEFADAPAADADRDLAGTADLGMYDSEVVFEMPSGWPVKEEVDLQQRTRSRTLSGG